VEPFRPYLENLSDLTSFDVYDNPIIDIVDHFTKYQYRSDMSEQYFIWQNEQKEVLSLNKARERLAEKVIN